MTTIPHDFLPAQAPPGAVSRKIDFAATIPEYKDLFAVVIENFLTEAECNEFIRLAEATTATSATTPVWERAMINIGNGRQVLATETRNCGRIIWDSPLVAQRLLDRLMPFLRDLSVCCSGGGGGGGDSIETLDDHPLVTGLAGRRYIYHLSRLNERLRFLKYEGDEYFRPHWDGCYRTPGGQEVSFYTIHLYLNGDGEQDLAELAREMENIEKDDSIKADRSAGSLLGGATSFIPNFEEERAVRVFPKTGSLLVFQQNDLLHGGDPVVRGTKYTMRTDVMYRKEARS